RRRSGAAFAEPVFRRGDRSEAAFRDEARRRLDNGGHARGDFAGGRSCRAGPRQGAMSTGAAPRLFSIPPGVSFLPTLVDALLGGRLVPDFSYQDGDDPLKLAEATIYVPTRRAARELRGAFVERLGKKSAILPTIRPLGEFDEEAALFDG